MKRNLLYLYVIFLIVGIAFTMSATAYALEIGDGEYAIDKKVHGCCAIRFSDGKRTAWSTGGDSCAASFADESNDMCNCLW